MNGTFNGRLRSLDSDLGHYKLNWMLIFGQSQNAMKAVSNWEILDVSRTKALVATQLGK